MTETAAERRARWLSVSTSASAMPTRRPEAAETAAREKRWERDMDAYKRLRQEGLHPKTIDGAADAELRDSKFQLETGVMLGLDGNVVDRAVAEAADVMG